MHNAKNRRTIMNEPKDTFTYTYSASQQKEVEAIRKKYIADDTPAEVDKMEHLRRLDASVSKKASIVALIVGIISALIMGTGMSLVMTDLGTKIGMTATMVPGTLIGIVGMIGVIVTYPLYQYIVRKERKKIAPQILKLTEELSQK